jgi:hypothetical protein
LRAPIPVGELPTDFASCSHSSGRSPRELRPGGSAAVARSDAARLRLCRVPALDRHDAMGGGAVHRYGTRPTLLASLAPAGLGLPLLLLPSRCGVAQHGSRRHGHVFRPSDGGPASSAEPRPLTEARRAASQSFPNRNIAGADEEADTEGPMPDCVVDGRHHRQSGNIALVEASSFVRFGRAWHVLDRQM